MSDYVVTLTDIDGQEIERRAKQRGYNSAADYLRALVAADALVEALSDDWQDVDEDAKLIESELRQSWHEAMNQSAHCGKLWTMISTDRTSF